MIEGARQLPWIQLAERRDSHGIAHLRDCEQCMRDRPVTARQEIGCGYEPPIENAFPWVHPGMRCTDVDRPKVCPGYTTKLPEVLEAAEAYFEMKELHRDPKPTAIHLRVIKTIAYEVTAMSSWEMRNPEPREP